MTGERQIISKGDSTGASGKGPQSHAGSLRDAVDMSKSLLQTNVVKDLRKQKERVKQRKSMLIYGTRDMKRKIYERGNRQLQSNQQGGRLNKGG
mmetsp:Transcript_6454/g.8649  ORF Transcript_6454/g.8649 Transcript_6454/m.8649 type:complete len:94 (+) Transcript_6454:119-400(+)